MKNIDNFLKEAAGPKLNIKKANKKSLNSLLPASFRSKLKGFLGGGGSKSSHAISMEPVDLSPVIKLLGDKQIKKIYEKLFKEMEQSGITGEFGIAMLYDDPDPLQLKTKSIYIIGIMDGDKGGAFYNAAIIGVGLKVGKTNWLAVEKA